VSQTSSSYSRLIRTSRLHKRGCKLNPRLGGPHSGCISRFQMRLRSLMISVNQEHEMGGCGSGGRWSSKEIISAYHQLDVRIWHRQGLLVLFGSFDCEEWHVEVVPPFNMHGQADWLILSRTDGRDETPPIRLEWTSCNYGGTRVWFRCPVRDCGRRVAILYSDRTDRTVSCRNCRHLTYESQHRSSKYRALHRVESIREKLGGSPASWIRFPKSPRECIGVPISVCNLKLQGRRCAF